jgi:hypothetical protein
MVRSARRAYSSAEPEFPPFVSVVDRKLTGTESRILFLNTPKRFARAAYKSALGASIDTMTDMSWGGVRPDMVEAEP